MTNFTACSIGGVNLYVDPDVNISVTPFGSAKPALDGTVFVVSLNTNPANTGFLLRLQINGAFLTAELVAALSEKVQSRELVRVEGIPGINQITRFFIEEMTHAPIRPGVLFPNDMGNFNNVPIKHSYQIRLAQVTKF